MVRGRRGRDGTWREADPEELHGLVARDLRETRDLVWVLLGCLLALFSFSFSTDGTEGTNQGTARLGVGHWDGFGWDLLAVVSVYFFLLFSSFSPWLTGQVFIFATLSMAEYYTRDGIYRTAHSLGLLW